MSKEKIHINCDLGERDLDGILNHDILFYPFIHAANIAAGGHAGDEYTIAKSIEFALQYDVEIGIHPSFPDRENFGRAKSTLSNTQLIHSLRKQIETFIKIASAQGATIHHVKAHGRLYHRLNEDENLANDYLNLISAFNPRWLIYGFSGSSFIDHAQNKNLSVKEESFMDRRYDAQLNLLSREDKDAVLSSEDTILQFEKLIETSHVICSDGKARSLKFDTICIHSDHSESLPILTKLFRSK